MDGCAVGFLFGSGLGLSNDSRGIHCAGAWPDGGASDLKDCEALSKGRFDRQEGGGCEGAI